MNAAANLMMKFGMERYKAAGVSLAHDGLGPVMATLAGNWILLAGLGLFATNVFLYAFALKGLPISIAYPVMVTLGFAIIAVVAGLYLGEHLGRGQWLGVLLILAGVWLVARGLRNGMTPAEARPAVAAISEWPAEK